MKTRSIVQFSAAFALVGSVIFTTAQPALGGSRHQAGPDQKITDLTVTNADVRSTLSALFLRYGLSFTIAPDVQGTVTISLKNVAFETAVQNITRQVDATYRVDAGIYEVVKRTPDPVPFVEEDSGGTTVTAVQDGEYLYVIRGTTIYKVRKTDLQVASRGRLQ